MRTLIIHNPKSGFGSDAIFEFERSLVHQGDTCTFHEIADGETPEELVRNAEDYDVCVLSGGDGTVTGLLHALRYRDVATCVFPSGTANLFCANVGNAMEPAALARACRVGHTALTDIAEVHWHDAEGTMHSRGFGLMCGMGFDAQLMSSAIPNKKSMGEMAYFAAALENPRPVVSHFTIFADGVVHECDGITCMVANNAMMQGDIEIVPDCRMDDGLLDVIVLETSDAVHVLNPIFAGILDRSGKNIGRPQIQTFTGKDIRVVSSEPIPLQVDGDVIEGTVTSYETSIYPAANRMIVDSMSRYHAEDSEAPRFSGTDEIAYPEA